MTFDEEAWVAQFVAMGGNAEAGRSIAKKMALVHSKQDQAKRPKRAARSMEHPGPAARPAPQPQAGEANGPPPDAFEQKDLFGEATALRGHRGSKAAAASRGSKAPSTTRRGRPAVPFDAQREKSQKELDLFHLSLEIEEQNARDTGSIGFLATAMIYASLPHSEVEGGVFKRRNGAISLTILNDPEIGLPYGKLPRLITAFLCTEAKRHAQTRGPEIHLGASQAEFMRKLGLTTGGSDIRRVRQQAQRLFTSTISLVGEPGSEFHWQKVNIADEGMLLWNPHDVNAKSRWESKLTLSARFYKECMDHAVPIDLRVLERLRSPLAIDIYVWMTYRYNSIVRPTPVTWKQLQWQFGSSYPSTKQGEADFKTNFKKQLRSVLAIYREAKLDVQQDVLILLPSPPHIAVDPA